jgi:hypothetical protein
MFALRTVARTQARSLRVAVSISLIPQTSDRLAERHLLTSSPPCLSEDTLMVLLPVVVIASSRSHDQTTPFGRLM